MASLRQRRSLRSESEELSDGTLEGVWAEVDALVAAEARRATDLSAYPPSVAQTILSRLTSELGVASVADVAPRIAELSSGARLSSSLVRRLQQALDVEADATVEQCLAEPRTHTHRTDRTASRAFGAQCVHR